MSAMERPFTFGTLELSEQSLAMLRAKSIEERDIAIAGVLRARVSGKTNVAEFENFFELQATSAVAPQVADIPLARRVRFYENYKSFVTRYMTSELYRSNESIDNLVTLTRQLSRTAQLSLLTATLNSGDDQLLEIMREKPAMNVAPLDRGELIDAISEPIEVFQQAA